MYIENVYSAVSALHTARREAYWGRKWFEKICRKKGIHDGDGILLADTENEEMKKYLKKYVIDYRKSVVPGSKAAYNRIFIFTTGLDCFGLPDDDTVKIMEIDRNICDKLLMSIKYYGIPRGCAIFTWEKPLRNMSELLVNEKYISMESYVRHGIYNL